LFIVCCLFVGAVAAATAAAAAVVQGDLFGDGLLVFVALILYSSKVTLILG